ncbi:MAG: hypothetical protein IJ225_01000 [Solobacterium sp.]|nr:hypothetical protein [Solobacterium sp.]
MKRLKHCIIALAVLLALYFMPFITVMSETPDGDAWRVPLGTWFAEQSETDITFKGPRSAYALARDSEIALHSGEEIKCYGETYYYQEDKDLSLSGYSVSSGLLSSVTYHYLTGNACLGWNEDKEIRWELGELSEADIHTSVEDAIEKEWLVIENGIALNPWRYNDFSRLVKQGVYSILRTMVIEGEEVTLVDIQLLETPAVQVVGDNEQEAYYRAAIRQGESIQENYYTRYSETAEVNPRVVSVYEKDAEGVEHETVLFTYSLQ